MHKEEKNKQTIYSTADQVVDMQAVNFMLIKHNWIFFVLDHSRQKIYYSITIYKINENVTFSSNN